MSYIKNTNITALITIVVLTAIMSLSADAQIVLDNGSFEDTPADATMPSGWWLVERATTPDILPGFWGVYRDASEGETFIGLITRENGTFESIGQRLPQTLEQDHCYQFSLDLAQGAGYVGYNTPIKVRIYIGSKRKSRDQLIFESNSVDNLDWKTFDVQFTPAEDYRYLILEVYAPQGPSTGGNVLIDNMTTIFNCSQDRA